jgi:Ca2+-binding RTX toxin-like protein
VAWAGSGVVVLGRFLNSADVNEYSVYLYAGEAHSFWVGGAATEYYPSSAPDPVLTLLDANANVIASDDNSGEGTNPVIHFTAPTDGWYRLKLTEAPGATAGGSYRLIINNRSFETDIPDHTGPGTPGVGFKMAVNDTIFSQGGGADVDVVAVTLSAGETYVIEVRGRSLPPVTSLDTYRSASGPTFSLLNEDGVVIERGYGPSNLAQVSFTPSVTGTYYVSADADGIYSLRVSDSAAPVTGLGGADYVPGNTSSTFAAAVDSGIGTLPPGIIQGTVNAVGDSDWYVASLAQGVTYQIDLRATGFYYSITGGLTDPLVEVRDAAGNLVASDNDGGTLNAASLVFTPSQTGLFYLAARDAGSGTGAYDLSLKVVGSVPPGAIYELVSHQDAAHPETISGLRHHNILVGGDGNDYIEGNGTIVGGGGNDTLNGAGRDDWFPDVGAGDSVNAGYGIDEIDSSVSYTMNLDDEVLVLLGGDNLYGTGNQYDNWIYGNAGSNLLTGNEGDDWLEGGLGNDTLNGASGFDAASYYGLGAVSVSLTAVGVQNTGGGGIDTLISIEGLSGGNGADRLTGNALSNFLYGGAGNDTLIGGGGRDLMTGAGGLDVMKLNALSDSGTLFAQRDVINTFAHGDKIDLSAIDANSKVAGNQAFTFATNFTRVAGQLQWDQTAPAGWLVQGDLNGDGAADFSVQIYASTAFGHPYAWDFIL